MPDAKSARARSRTAGGASELLSTGVTGLVGTVAGGVGSGDWTSTTSGSGLGVEASVAFSTSGSVAGVWSFTATVEGSLWV